MDEHSLTVPLANAISEAEMTRTELLAFLESLFDDGLRQAETIACSVFTIYEIANSGPFISDDGKTWVSEQHLENRAMQTFVDRLDHLIGHQSFVEYSIARKKNHL